MSQSLIINNSKENVCLKLAAICSTVHSFSTIVVVTSYNKKIMVAINDLLINWVGSYLLLNTIFHWLKSFVLSISVLNPLLSLFCCSFGQRSMRYVRHYPTNCSVQYFPRPGKLVPTSRLGTHSVFIAKL